jgi:hypothetical protein
LNQVRLCQCGCKRPVAARNGRGRPTAYASPECRRSVEYKARKAARLPASGDPRNARKTTSVKIKDSGALAYQWFYWRYPEANWDLHRAEHELILLALFIDDLPAGQQEDFACRALEAIGGPTGTARLHGPDEVFARGRVRHEADSWEDPVTLAELRNFYRPGECSEGGCHEQPHALGLCRGHYDQRRAMKPAALFPPPALTRDS